jgi:hypothetical protein
LGVCFDLAQEHTRAAASQGKVTANFRNLLIMKQLRVSTTVMPVERLELQLSRLVLLTRFALTELKQRQKR